MPEHQWPTPHPSLKPRPSTSGLLAWVEEVAALTEPDDIHWCDGSAEEYDQLCQTLVDAGTFERLSDAKRPNSYLALSDPGDVARVEDRTFICSEREDDAGPDQQLARPGRDARDARPSCSTARCAGRTMYVVPFSMGPLGSPIAYIGVQLTDSAYVAVLDADHDPHGPAARSTCSATTASSCPACTRSGMPLADGVEDVPWPCNAENKYIVHFPETREIWSYGSGYGGNALLGKKCFALRIASVMARDEGWMAEHMLILKLTSPEGEVKYITGAFPSACGKTNLAMLIPTLEGWKVETIGDDIAWMKFGEDGRLYAINPEAGFFGVAPGHRRAAPTPTRSHTIERNTIFTNCAKTDDGDVWWEGMTGEPPAHADRLARQRLDARRPTRPAAHPNARFTDARRRSARRSRREWEDPDGRADRRDPVRRPPLDRRAAGARGARLGARRVPRLDRCPRRRPPPRPATVGKLRFDPLAMLPFCGYNMADYFAPLAEDRPSATAPSCRGSSTSTGSARTTTASSCGPASARTRACWRGSSRRCEGTAEAVETPIGLVPPVGEGGIDTDGLDVSDETMAKLLEVDAEGWSDAAAADAASTTRSSATSCPTSCATQLTALEQRLDA